MSWFYIVLFIFTVLSGTACSSNSLRVQSNPEGAEVQLISREGSVVKLGITPIEIDARNNRALYNDPTQIRVSKDGYTPQTAVVPALGLLGGNGSVNFNLKDTELPASCTAREDAFNELAQGIAEASSMIQKKRFGDAIGLLKNLSTKFNSVAVIYDLQGNAFYLQRDLVHALEAYKRSNALIPNNSQTQRMINRLQQLQGNTAGG